MTHTSHACPRKLFTKKRKRWLTTTTFFSTPCYNGTMLKQDYYNDFFEIGQLKINFNFFELGLPDDDPVYTLKKVMEELNFSGLLACCSDKGRTGRVRTRRLAISLWQVSENSPPNRTYTSRRIRLSRCQSNFPACNLS